MEGAPRRNARTRGSGLLLQELWGLLLVYISLRSGNDMKGESERKEMEKEETEHTARSNKQRIAQLNNWKTPHIAQINHMREHAQSTQFKTKPVDQTQENL